MRIAALAAVEMALVALAVSYVQRWRQPHQPRLVVAGRTRRRHPPHVEQRIEIAIAAGGAVALSLVAAGMWLLLLHVFVELR